jgi:hypothetical protein
MLNQWVSPARWGGVAMMAVGVLFAAEAAHAQGGPQLQQEQLQLDGTVEGMQGNLLYVTRDDGSKWVVQMPNVGRPNRGGGRQFNRRSPVSYTGSADPAWLRPGMIVRFSALIDKKGEVVEPVRELGVVTLRTDIQVGITQDAPADVGGFFGEAELSDPKNKDVASYTVVGKLGSLKKGKFVVATTGATIKGELDESVRIYVDVEDYSLMRVGDKVVVNGWYYEGQEGKAQARRVQITGAEPLGVPESKEKRQLLEGTN